MFDNALIFALTAQGIPFYYYGSEQYYSGGNDPQNRESLWQDMDTSSKLYKATALVNQARKQTESYKHPFEEKYVLDNFYAFKRGDMLVALTNNYDDVNQNVPNLAYPDGTTLCNIFDSDDCQQVNGGSLNISLSNGHSKIYVPKTSEEQFIQ